MKKRIAKEFLFIMTIVLVAILLSAFYYSAIGIRRYYNDEFNKLESELNYDVDEVISRERVRDRITAYIQREINIPEEFNNDSLLWIRIIEIAKEENPTFSLPMILSSVYPNNREFSLKESNEFILSNDTKKNDKSNRLISKLAKEKKLKLRKEYSKYIGPLERYEKYHFKIAKYIFIITVILLFPIRYLILATKWSLKQIR